MPLLPQRPGVRALSAVSWRGKCADPEIRWPRLDCMEDMPGLSRVTGHAQTQTQETIKLPGAAGGSIEMKNTRRLEFTADLRGGPVHRLAHEDTTGTRTLCGEFIPAGRAMLLSGKDATCSRCVEAFGHTAPARRELEK